VASFAQFVSSIRDTGNGGTKFEIFVKWFLKTEPIWAAQVDQVWLWEDWPDRWGADLGIDLIFKSKIGEIWAVQAKCYDPGTSITKKHLDSFLSESSRSIIDRRLLIASTDLIGRNAIKTCEGQEKPVVRYMLRDFEDAHVTYPTCVSKLAANKPKKKPKPKPHQRQAIKAVVKDTRPSQQYRWVNCVSNIEGVINFYLGANNIRQKSQESSGA